MLILNNKLYNLGNVITMKTFTKNKSVTMKNFCRHIIINIIFNLIASRPYGDI
jgi:hypothetical protein